MVIAVELKMTSFSTQNKGWECKVQILGCALSTNAAPGTRNRSWWWLPIQYEYGMKEIAFCLISLQLAGKYILSFWKSVANYAKKSWFFKSLNILNQQFKIIITQKLSCLRIRVNLAGRVYAANWGKNCALHFAIVFLVPVLFMAMDFLLNACFLIKFKWPIPVEKVLEYPCPLQNGEKHSLFSGIHAYSLGCSPSRGF